MTNSINTDTPTPQSVIPETPQEPVKAPPLPYTFKASLKEYGRRLNKINIIIAIVFLSFFVIRFGVIVGGMSAVGFVLVIFGILSILSTRTITINPDGIKYRNGLGKVRTIHYEEIEGAKVFLNYVEANFGALPRVIIGVKNGAPLSLVAAYWQLEDLEKLLAVLRDKQVTTEYFEQPATYGMIAKQFPTYASYIERYPGRIAAITCGVILLLAVAIALFVAFVD